MKGDYYNRIEEAFLAAGIDPEFSSVIHAYNNDVYVHALVNTLAKYMQRVEELEDSPNRQFVVDRKLWEQLQMSNWIKGPCEKASCTKCVQDDPSTWRHDA